MMQKFILRVLLIAFVSFSPVFCEDFAIGNALSKILMDLVTYGGDKHWKQYNNHI